MISLQGSLLLPVLFNDSLIRGPNSRNGATTNFIDRFIICIDDGNGFVMLLATVLLHNSFLRTGFTGQPDCTLVTSVF